MKKLPNSELSVEFPLDRQYRKQLDFRDKDFSLNGQLLLLSTEDCRIKEHIIHPYLPRNNKDEESTAGQFYGTALLHSIFRYILRLYKKELIPQVWQSIDRSIKKKMDLQDADKLYNDILRHYPPTALYHNRKEAEALLHDPEKGDQWKQWVLEQIFLLRMIEANPALEEMRAVIAPVSWESQKVFHLAADLLEEGLGDLPEFGPDKQTLPELLRSPILYSDKLQEQLRYIRERWGDWLKDIMDKILGGLDLLSEENQVRLPGPGPAEGVDFSLLEDDMAHYSPDSNWMPRVILLAKNALVWLFQLSHKYRRDVHILSDIPNEELDFLQSCGFTGLWLIGLWERSPASREIKVRCGNPEAEASAYSLFQYRISQRLGGPGALENLKERCLLRGIHLASDMVPNHTGIDSEWVREHPDWFIQTSQPPFPQYSYSGENLSGDPNLEIRLEDHYYDRSDCAVSFLRIDKRSGEERYIYHGNDGTSMPWNDTAQIDFLNPEAREAVIQQILEVARQFPIIRFDAAMVLARKHVRRLWFPKPGEGGAIPSRSSYSMSDQDFYQAMPEEFWREVVQRVADECPETLLLAEAFWMMEGYFVRNLGMHRVYNSAFMNMVKDEKNDEFRGLIKKTLDHDPEILKRYVNFMSNPDEDTAEAQFGRGDKYFGVLAMMLTLPGLPMLSHGQLEGYREKYGMEYSRAYYDEEPDMPLMERHAREIYPIMKRRHCFADASRFHLYDVRHQSGQILDCVYAYSNQFHDDYSLFLYNNRLEEASGNIHYAYGKSYHLAHALGLSPEENRFVIFQEQKSSLWFIRRSKDLYDNGLYLHLSGYNYQLFHSFREIEDGPDRLYQALWLELDGRGIESLEQAILDYRLKPLYKVLDSFFNNRNLQAMADGLMKKNTGLPEFLQNAEQVERWLKRLALRLSLPYSKGSGRKFRKKAKQTLRSWRNLFYFHRQNFPEGFLQREAVAEMLSLWIFLQCFSEISKKTPDQLLQDWDVIEQLGKRREGPFLANLPFNCDRFLASFPLYKNWYPCKDPLAYLSSLFDRENFRKLCGVNLHQNVLWFNKQGFEDITAWLFVLARISLQNRPLGRLLRGRKLWHSLKLWMEKYDESEFRVQHMHTHHSSG